MLEKTTSEERDKTTKFILTGYKSRKGQNKKTAKAVRYGKRMLKMTISYTDLLCIYLVIR